MTHPETTPFKGVQHELELTQSTAAILLGQEYFIRKDILEIMLDKGMDRNENVIYFICVLCIRKREPWSGTQEDVGPDGLVSREICIRVFETASLEEAQKEFQSKIELLNYKAEASLPKMHSLLEALEKAEAEVRRIRVELERLSDR